ncbi:major facilitator superfamily domain-containing protein [Dichotomocladium elegans]|nr:major facilitator superfamily domain-containing protein [Dichotomocladium elegans]
MDGITKGLEEPFFPELVSHDIMKEKHDKTSSMASTMEALDISNSNDPRHNQEGYDSTLEWTEEEEKQVIRIIDMRLMPFMLLMSFVLNMDRTNISNAISDNMAADLGFTNDGVNTAILTYSLVFTLFTLPSNPIAKRVGAHIWIPFLMTSWAINFGTFMLVRVLIAVTEAGFIPACLGYLTGWYKTKELATRLSIFWGVQSLASAFSGLISFGIFRLAGTAGLEGWKWLFLIDGILTHLVAFLAFWYLPSRATKATGWFTERQAKISVTRVIRDDLSKTDQHSRITWTDIKEAILDTKVWLHLLTTFSGMMTDTPITNYLPTLIKNGGFPTTTANLLTVPAYIINLVFSIIIASSSDRYGEVCLHALIGNVWQGVGYAALWALPADAGRWKLFAAATVTAGSPSWHGMHIAYMSANLSPAGKRAFALGAIVGAANICGVPGSQIYQASDAPRYAQGNMICVIMKIFTILLFITIRFRYSLTNKWRASKWKSMTDAERMEYMETTKHLGSNRLDYRFLI